jgi:pimeloyl-ACP methyl ester carboxylesterase
MSPTIRSRDGTTIAYSRTGEGPPLILIDPAGGFRVASPISALAGRLAGSYTVITYDRRGRGESGDTPPYAVEREVDDLSGLIDIVGGGALVYGFSSGAVLALHAAAAGIPIRKLALLEPPIPTDEDPPDLTLGPGIERLVAEGRRGDAVELFQRSIGVPDEYIAGMRDEPWWAALESVAHTLAYDCVVTSTITDKVLRRVAVPTLILDSTGSDDRFGGWARRIADRIPNAVQHSLPGEWHGVAPDVLTDALIDFFERDASTAGGPRRTPRDET